MYTTKFNHIKTEKALSVIDVADYILMQTGDMPALRLNLLCYFCYGLSFPMLDEQLFEDRFFVTATSVKSEKLMKQIESRGKSINDEITRKDMNINYKNKGGMFTQGTQTVIDTVLNSYGNWETNKLERFIRIEYVWKQARIKKERFMDPDYIERYFRDAMEADHSEVSIFIQ